MVTANYDPTAKIVDRSGRVIRVLRERGFYLFAARFSADGRLVATVADRRYDTPPRDGLGLGAR